MRVLTLEREGRGPVENWQSCLGADSVTTDLYCCGPVWKCPSCVCVGSLIKVLSKSVGFFFQPGAMYLTRCWAHKGPHASQVLMYWRRKASKGENCPLRGDGYVCFSKCGWGMATREPHNFRWSSDTLSDHTSF